MVDPPIYGTPRIEKKFVFERQKKKTVLAIYSGDSKIYLPSQGGV